MVKLIENIISNTLVHKHKSKSDWIPALRARPLTG